jgi:hypothetical protein
MAMCRPFLAVLKALEEYERPQFDGHIGSLSRYFLTFLPLPPNPLRSQTFIVLRTSDPRATKRRNETAFGFLFIKFLIHA